MIFRLPWRLRFHPFLYRKRKFTFYDESAIAADPSKKAAYAYAFVVDRKAPTMFIAPGGGYGVVCLSYEGVDIAKEFNKRGINAFVLNYRVGKDARQPNPQEDMAALISYVFAHKEHFGIDMDGYSVMGFSAGGHLAASFCTENVGYARFGLPKPRFAALCYAVITLGEGTHEGTMMNLTGGDKVLREAYSVEKHADSYPPTFMWCCEDDAAVPPLNSKNLKDVLEKNNIPVKLVTYSKGGHGLGLGHKTEAEGWFDEMIAFGRQFM